MLTGITSEDSNWSRTGHTHWIGHRLAQPETVLGQFWL